jgi:hypothetical protein
VLDDESLFLAVHELAKTGQRAPTLLLLSHIKQPARPGQIRSKGVQIGFRVISQWNLSDVLKAAAKEGQVAQLADGWKLLAPGFTVVAEFFRPDAPLIAETRHGLRSYLANITNEQRRIFLDEAIRCFDAKAHRAAVVLSWVGAVHILQEYVVAHHRTAFNRAGVERAAKYASAGKPFNFVPIKTIKDFGTIAEIDFLQICQDAGVLHKAEKQVLEERLNLRNQCGHPNPLIVAEHTVAHHIEVLMLNVYSKY